MTQKINIVSNKTGLIYLWNSNFPVKSNSFKLYKKQIKIKKYLKSYIFFLLFDNKIEFDTLKLNYANNYFSLTIPFYSLEKKFISKNKLRSVFFYWLQCPIIFKWYKINTFSVSAVLLSNYIQNFIEINNYSLKKILNQINLVLLNQINKQKIIYIKSGLKIVQFKGFKIQISGCFESSKSQMSKTLKYTFGCNSLTTLKGYIEYTEKTIFTKFGTCGLKIWLFFEII